MNVWSPGDMPSLPVQFSALGVGCAGAAVLLYEGVRLSELALRPLPRYVSAPLGGALCGVIAYKFPQVCSRTVPCACQHVTHTCLISLTKAGVKKG